METLKTIRLQLSSVEEAYRERRLQEVVETLTTLHDLIDVLASAFLNEQLKAARAQLERLVDVGLVVADLIDRLEIAQHEPVPQRAAAMIEDVWKDIREMLDASNKLLVRTNIFARGKKTFIAFGPNDSLRDVAKLLRRRYAQQISDYIKKRGERVVNTQAIDIFFYGARVWEDPDEAILSEHLKVSEVVKQEPEGVLWFPALPGDLPILFEEEDEEDGYMNVLENFTIEADLGALQAEMVKLSEGMATEPIPEPIEATVNAFLIRGEGTDREEKIPVAGERLTLGRGRENDIQILNDIKVSRFHCRVVREGENYFIEDNSSSNGTMVDGEMITRRQLVGGELLGIGNTSFRFYVEI